MSRQHYRVIRQQTILSAVANILLATIKLIAGIWGQSQALVADGLHSLGDLLTDAFVFVAAKAGSKSADQDHPYGHRRIETLATLLIALSLMLIGGLLAWHILLDWWHRQVIPHPHLLVVWVAAAAALINECLFRVMRRAAEGVRSPLLLGNAWHHRSDAWVSAVVVVGALISPYTHFPVDSIAAVFIAVLIMHMGIKMIWRGSMELIDTAVPDDQLQHIKQVVAQTSGVQSVHQLRTRSYAGDIYVDVHVIVSPRLSVSEGHYIADQVSSRLCAQITTVIDVTVHIDPEDDELVKPSVDLPDRAFVSAQLSAHASDCPMFACLTYFSIDYLDGNLYLGFYFKADDAATSRELMHYFSSDAAALKHGYWQVLQPVLKNLQRVDVYYMPSLSSN